MRNLISSLVVTGAMSLGSAYANDTRQSIENMGVQAAPRTLGESVAYTASEAADQRAVTVDYWTREMVATTPAMEMPVDMGTGEVDAFALDGEAVTGPEGSVPASKAEPGSNRFHKEAYSEDWAALNDEDWGALYVDSLGEVRKATDDVDGVTLEESLAMDVSADEMAGTTSIYTDYPVNEKTGLWKLYPHRWVGKFTFTTPEGNRSCSATAINKDHIVTAAHCVYGTASSNSWYTDKAFTPAYRNGNAPYGTFPSAGCRILTAWADLSGFYSINSWARHDVAVCKMGKNSAGKTLNQAVGWAAYGWNWGDNQLHFNSGYPARDYNDTLLSSPAQYLRSCTAESFKQTTDTLGSGCQYGRGISGGSWLRGYKPNYVTGSVNSVNSGLFIGQSNLYGARFTSGNIKTLCDDNGC